EADPLAVNQRLSPQIINDRILDVGGILRVGRDDRLTRAFAHRVIDQVAYHEVTAILEDRKNHHQGYRDDDCRFDHGHAAAFKIRLFIEKHENTPWQVES